MMQACFAVIHYIMYDVNPWHNSCTYDVMVITLVKTAVVGTTVQMIIFIMIMIVTATIIIRKMKSGSEIKEAKTDKSKAEKQEKQVLISH